MLTAKHSATQAKLLCLGTVREPSLPHHDETTVVFSSTYILLANCTVAEKKSISVDCAVRRVRVYSLPSARSAEVIRRLELKKPFIFGTVHYRLNFESVLKPIACGRTI